MLQANRNILPLAAISAVVLGLEVLQTRLLAYSIPMLFIYAVVGIALLGFGAAGTLVAARQHWLEPEVLPRYQAWSALAFCASVVIAHAVFGRLTPFIEPSNFATLGLSAVLCLPFFAAGTLITLSLSAQGSSDAAYAANLIGSGLGCFLPVLALGALTAEQLLAAIALLAFVCAIWYVANLPQRTVGIGVATAAVFVLVLAALAAPAWMFPVQPEPEPLGQLAWQYRYAHENGIVVEKAYDRWNPTGRIEIVRLHHVPAGPEPYPAMFYAQDSSAGSSLFQWDGRDIASVKPSATEPGSFVSRLCTETQYGQGYYTHRSRVLVIGLGGAPDLQCALYHRADSVDVVEINQDSIAAVRGKFNRWLGNVGQDPRVHFYERDGRSFIHATDEKYDLIQLSGVDTKNLLASGSLALSENYLYTREAFGDYFDHLKPGGAISMMRFGEPEQIRLANTAAAILRDRGITHPEQHIGLLNTGLLNGVIIRRSPWTPEDAKALNAQLHPEPFRGVSVFYYGLNGVPLDTPSVVTWLPHVGLYGIPGYFMTALATGSLARFTKEYPTRFVPVTDDWPFFFDVHRYDLSSLWGMQHIRALVSYMLVVLVVAGLLVVLPAWAFRKTRAGVRQPSVLLFFAFIGLAFILIEVWLFHRFTMFLGHQVYSITVVLSSLLVSTGFGALLGNRLGVEPRRRAQLGIAFTIVWLAIGALALQPLLDVAASWPLALRAALTILYIGPLGLALGQPFVSGIDWLGQHAPGSRPLCIGVNGVASVFASIAVVSVSMTVGYRGVLISGAMLYVAAALAISRFTVKGRSSSGAPLPGAQYAADAPRV